MGRKPKTAGIPVNSPALLVCGPGPVPKVKLLVSANGRLFSFTNVGGGGWGGEGRLSDNWKGFICCAPEFNQALTTDCEGDGDS